MVNFNNIGTHPQSQASTEVVEAFQSLCRGRVDAWGSVEGKANKEPVTLEHYRKHLRGEVSLGIYPLLDDGTCHFFAVDLDEKDFDKAKAIRQELSNNFIPSYIAESKSKGYHIYGFALEKFVAKEIRQIIHYVLNKLDIKAEVFPKQDTLDGLITLGNYINLPCFGYTRPFLSGDLKEVPLAIAVERIRFVPQESILRVLRTLPEEQPLRPKKVRGRQKKHPPCIDAILHGVDQGQRDEAAFALSRHYLDQHYLPEEVLGLLKVWDARNATPLNDDRLLEIKVRSAEKGYAFGCSSITDNAMLAQFCIGEDKCDWLKQASKEQKKTEEPDLEPSITPLSPAPPIEQVKNIVMRNFPETDAVWLTTDAALSVFGTLLLADLSHPIALNLQDCPSSWKTTVLDFFTIKGVTYRSDHFTPKSFVTHAANIKKEKLAEIDLLPRIKDKVIIVPELAPLFGVRKEDLLDNISILTRVFDGQGYLSDSGVQGRRGYSGSYIFGWLGATTPLADSVWFMLGKLGSRWLFLSMDSDSLTEKQLVGMMASQTCYSEKLNECRLAVSSFISELFQKHAVRSITWSRSADSPELLGIIARLGNLVRRLRGTIAIWGEGGDHTPPIIEYPPRLVMLLYDLARGHAIVHDRRQLAREDIDLVARVALSSMPDARRRVFRELIDAETLGTGAVMETLKVTRPTALKIMRTLAALGAVGIREEKVDGDETLKKVEIWLLPKDEWLPEFFAHTQRQNTLHSGSSKGDATGVKENDAVYAMERRKLGRDLWDEFLEEIENDPNQ